MAEARSNSGRDRESSMDDPPMSRLFVVYNKQNTEEDFRESFERFGTVEDIWIIKDKLTGENKGVAYIKFSKTSEAALALEELNGKSIGNSDRPIKVLVASNRHSGSKRQAENEQEKCLRLFLVTPKTITEDELHAEFSKYGIVDNISIIKDRASGQPKGFAYIKYNKFSHSALAFENCPARYKAVFADPKSSKNSNQNSDNYSHSRNDDYHNNGPNRQQNDMQSFFKMQAVVKQPTCLEIICSNIVNQDQLWRLFDIIPGLDYCQVLGECGIRSTAASVVYTNPEAAVYAKDKLHGLEYPPGERLIVKLAGIDNRLDAHFVDKRMRKDSMCNVDLPPAAPLADSDRPVVRRCFIVVASSIPNAILKNIFCTFENLIDVYLLPNRNCGYVKYACERSAQRAIDTLNGAEICGVRIKVMEAEEMRDEGRKRMRRDD